MIMLNRNKYMIWICWFHNTVDVYVVGKPLVTCFVTCLCITMISMLLNSRVIPIHLIGVKLLESNQAERSTTAVMRAGGPAGVRTRYNITFSNPGRLGNMMFAYASTLAIARNNNLIPVLPSSSYLRDIFQVTAGVLDEQRSSSPWISFHEKQACAFDRRTLHLKTGRNINMVGYLQSWKYFNKFGEEVRRQLRFVDSIRSTADAYIRSVVEWHFGRNSSDVVTVGIHVRRTDMATEEAFKQGYSVANVDYIKSAMFYFQTKYKRVVFIVCTDDVTWCEQKVSPLDKRVAISRNARTDATDLAILARCQHSIITTGTFGWWGAWLAGGTTIYYKRFPIPGSSMASNFNKGDFFPPHWIGL